ncbi:hypothetical protein E6R60_26515 [Streptomyces sp. A0642]|uniref:hypothetical protein n=1 Tax=Streptomyces sp. A0642 TaxID=2563100 RepID=UPI0010A26186|nr:hypothetical protein [Streptomyces sp. A0642]THA72487.1 hypothetical protein E6R60_26515 [Streptomyces sp. A0642]
MIAAGALFAGLFAGFSLASESVPPAPYPNSENGPDAARPPASSTIPGTGTFLVGADVKPGLYHSDENASCSWKRTKDATGESDSVIARNVTAGDTYVDLKGGEFFDTSECHAWQLVDRGTARGTIGQG